jgi:hypothetical protein
VTVIRLSWIAILAMAAAACAQENAVPAAQDSPAAVSGPALAPAGEGVRAAAPAPRGTGAAVADDHDHAAPSSGGATAAAAPSAAAPRARQIDVPAGTVLALKLTTPLASNSSRVEDTVRATLAKPIVVDGATVVPAGAEVVGSVVEAVEAGRVKGRASLAIRFTRLEAWDTSYDMRTARIAREAEGTRDEDAKKIGIGAGAGAVVGAVAGGRKGALIGGAIGAGAGTGAALATRGEEVVLAAGTALTTSLQEALPIVVPVD